MNKFRMMSATLGILGATLTPSLRADESDKTTYITTNQPLQIQGTLLAPGRHMLKLGNPDSDRHTVQVFSADGTELETIIQAIPAYRVELSDATQLILANPQDGQPATLKFWFYPGDNSGLEFVIPKTSSVNAHKLNHKGNPDHASQAADDATSTRD
jgi:hypothetical protein